MADYSQVARPYARAVLELATEEQDYAGWGERLAFAAAVASDPQMQALIEGPRLTHEQKAEVFLAVAGEQLGDEGQKLVRIMADNDRLPAMPEVARSYEELRKEAEGTLEVHVVAARRLEPKHEKVIADALKEKLGRQVTLSSDIDQSLLAGAVIHAGDIVIDGSLRGRLGKLALNLGR